MLLPCPWMNVKAQVALDFLEDRNWIVWDAEFKEKKKLERCRQKCSFTF